MINNAPCRIPWLSLLEEGGGQGRTQRGSLTLWQSLEWERGDRGWKTATVLAPHWQLSDVTVGKFYEDESWYCCACSFLQRKLASFYHALSFCRAFSWKWSMYSLRDIQIVYKQMESSRRILKKLTPTKNIKTFFLYYKCSSISNQAVSLKMSNRGSISIVAFQSNFHKAEA